MNLATSETVSPNSPTVSSSPSSPIIDPSLGEDEPRALITYCDESGIWPSVEKDFLLRLPIQKLMWKSIRGTKIIDTLQVRLKQFHESLLPRSALYSSATPMLHLYFLNCDDTELYRAVSKQKIKDWLALFAHRRDHEWLIVYVGTSDSKPKFLNIKASVFDKLKSDFQKDKKDRVFLFRLLDPETNDQVLWGEFLNHIKEGILHSFESQVARYEEDIQRLDAQRLVPGWNFCQFFLLKERLAQCFVSVSLFEEAGIQYEELEATHFQTLNSQISSFSTFGGTSPGDDAIASTLFSKSPSKDFRTLMLSNQISVFDFRIHLIRQQLQLLQQQKQPLNLLQRSVSFLYQFHLNMSENAATLPIWFQQSFSLCFIDTVLALCDSILPSFKGRDGEQWKSIHSSRLALILLACAQLEDIGSKIHRIYGRLEGIASPDSNYTVDKPFTDIDPNLRYEKCLRALRDFDSYIKIISQYLNDGLLAAKLSQKWKVELNLKTKLADFRFIQDQWTDASALYKEISQIYKDSGWLSIDRSLLLRLSLCYQHLNHTRSYIITSLQIMASMISQVSSPSGIPIALDLNDLKKQSEQLTEPVISKFSPLFQCILPPVLHSVPNANSIMSLNQVIIHSYLPIHFPIDKVAITLVGGETSDVVFVQHQLNLQPGENALTLVWESPSTSGQYVAEKMVMEAGKLLFVCNLIKENRKHTLQIHEPPGPLSLSLSLPSCILPNHSRLSLIIFSDDPALQVDKGILSIRIFTPDTQIERIKFEDPDITSLEEPTRIEPNKFQLPSFKKSLRLLLCMTSSSSSVSLKVVLEYNSKDIKRTVSVSESVSFMPLPMVETEFQVIGKSTFLILTMSNAFSSPLCIDDYDLELVNGKTKCIHLFPATLMSNQKFTTSYELLNVPPDGHLKCKVRVHHHYRNEDVSHFIMLRFKEALQKQNLELYFSAVWTFLHKQLEGIVINDLILKGEQSLTSISSTFSTLTHVSPQVLDQLQTVTKTLLEQLQPLCLDTLTPVPSRVAEYELTLSIPSDHLEYEWHVNFSDKLMVGHPIPCSITISHHHASWVEQDNVDKPLVLHYDFDLASEMWLVIGAKRRQFTLNKASTISFEFSLVPVVSGNLLLPSIQFYPDLSTSSLPQRSISFQTSIQSLSNWFKSGQTTGSSSTFSVTKIGSQSHSLTIQPELVWTVVVVGNNVIGVQKKNMSTQSLPSELKLGSTLDLRRTSHFSPVVV